MAVNTSVYGTPEQWINAGFQQVAIVDKNKWAYFQEVFPSFGLASGVSAGKLSYTQGIDNSLSYCGLGSVCALSNLAYVTKSGNTVSISDYQERSVTNFAFFDQPRNIEIGQSSTFFTDRLYNFTWETAGADNFRENYNGILAPYTLINPKNIVFLIRVTAYNSTFTHDINKVTLKEYLTSYKTTYPNIGYVFIEPYIGDISLTSIRELNAGLTSNPNFKAFQLGLLDEYIINSKNIRFFAYDFWNMPVFGNFSPTFSLPHSDDDTPFGIVAYTPNSKEHIKIVQQGEYPYGAKYYTEYYPEFEEDILKTVACFGMYFTPDYLTAYGGSLTSAQMYIGVLDEDGVGRGKYFKGADTVRAPQADSAFKDMHTIDYDPEGVHIDYDTSSHYGILSYYNFNKMYSVTNEQVELLYRELTAAMSAKPNDMTETDYSKGTFLTNDPIDCIISLRKYPITSTTSSSSVHDIYFGGYKSDLSAPYANNAETIRYNFTGTKAFISKFGGGFLDKEGYTTAELFVPFCGSVKLPVNEFIDRTLSVKLVVDYLTGTCTAYIELDDIPRMTINGSIGVDVPVTGIQTNDLQNTINRNIANLKTAQITAGMTARSGASIASGSGSASSAIMSAINMINPIAIANKMDSTEKVLISRDIAEYNLYHTEIPFKTVSAGDALTAGMGEWSCRLSITRPVLSPDYLNDPSVYAKTIGYACLKTGKVSDFSGLTVGTIDLSGINCTDKEKAMIIQAFKSGVYL